MHKRHTDQNKGAPSTSRSRMRTMGEGEKEGEILQRLEHQIRTNEAVIANLRREIVLSLPQRCNVTLIPTRGVPRLVNMIVRPPPPADRAKSDDSFEEYIEEFGHCLLSNAMEVLCNEEGCEKYSQMKGSSLTGGYGGLLNSITLEDFDEAAADDGNMQLVLGGGDDETEFDDITTVALFLGNRSLSPAFAKRLYHACHPNETIGGSVRGPVLLYTFQGIVNDMDVEKVVDMTGVPDMSLMAPKLRYVIERDLREVGLLP